ncbi:HAD hydrolase-like protein [Candidatus Nanobsidianus stetteri]|jgi:FMN phosphatase YigB (HAD superfamily)|uniref:HAD hydrolase-like protein n=1 Tax=Nanobsidianus stetteri TaxID=1294122 RepID=A0A2T9WLZ3_NANST|nr:HAD hydrolase-like protein [Candidatus Nanobsidianus stetteri]MCC5446852.1 HAD hydrolase-like protein [Candidatus Nanobsidianus stetteri]
MIISLDYDGTLVDSYTVIPLIYEKIREELNLYEGFTEAMLAVEDLGDYFGIFERGKWIRFLIKDNPDEIIEYYWKMRSENQIILPGTIEFLEKYKNRDLYLVTSTDDTKDIKIKRIKKTNLDKYFKDILVYGTEEFKTIIDVFEYLIDIDRDIIYIDDKNTNLYQIKNKLNIKLFKRIYYPPYPLKLAWYYPEIDLPKIINIFEIEKYIRL